MTGPSDELRLMVEVWRAVAGHLQLPELLAALGPTVARRLPLRALAVLGPAPARGAPELLAAARPGPGGAWAELRAADPAAAALIAAARPGAPPPAGPRVLGLWAAPLRGEDGAAAGSLCAELGAPGAPLAALAALVPAFEIGLQNDRRLQELARLREAAEADRRALLTRLGRQDIADTVVGEETGLREVMRRVGQVAPTDAPVLILGETGSGKEVVARAVHERSRRRGGPFLRVNCGAIPSELIDSELFGHERGSFTGAVGQRQGWFERADGGTLFLDEVGELPAAAQVRLLRVLQDGSFERVGGQKPLKADVRVIAATHRDMGGLVRAGRFREDLWYRIAVFPVVLPSLRERPEDLPALARHFAGRAGTRLRGQPLEPSADDLARLARYDWPGNVRELSAVIERAAILGDGRHLDVERALGHAPAASAPAAAAPGAARGPASGLPPVAGAPTLEALNRAAIEEALRACGGRIQGPGGAAERLGLAPSTLRSRMERLGVGRGGP